MAAQDYIVLGLVVVGSAVVLMNKDAIASWFQQQSQGGADYCTANPNDPSCTGTGSGTVGGSCNCILDNASRQCLCAGTTTSCKGCKQTHASSTKNKPGILGQTAEGLSRAVQNAVSAVPIGVAAASPSKLTCNCQGHVCQPGGEFCDHSFVAQAYPGYYRGYSIPVSGPQWQYTQPASRAPEALTDGNEYRSYMTTVNPQTGAKTVTIDKYFPAGFLNSQADYRSSLNDPAVRGSS